MANIDVLKCNVCNIVINELLSYIQNKVSVVDEETLVLVCTSTFTADDIKNAKSLLFDAIPTDKRRILRKNKGKDGRDLGDILNLFKSTEPDLIPVFVAKDLDKLPPIMFDHLDCSKLLKDIATIKSEIAGIKTSYATQDSVSELKTEILRIRNYSLPPTSAFKVNTKRGAWVDNEPVGLSSRDCCGSSLDRSYTYNNESVDFTSPISRYRDMRVDKDTPTERRSCERQRSKELSQTGAGVRRSAGGAHSPVVSQEASDRTGGAAVTSHVLSPAVQVGDQLIATGKEGCSYAPERRHVTEQPLIARDVLTNENEFNGGWKRVSYRKKQIKYRFLGQSGVAKDLECNFKAAEKKIPIFITNIHCDTTESDIINYIRNKTKETVALEKIVMKIDRGHKAYKFLTSESNVSMYMNEMIWPTGIIFRRFVSFKHRKTNSNNTANGPILSKNG